MMYTGKVFFDDTEKGNVKATFFGHAKVRLDLYLYEDEDSFGDLLATSEDEIHFRGIYEYKNGEFEYEYELTLNRTEDGIILSGTYLRRTRQGSPDEETPGNLRFEL